MGDENGHDPEKQTQVRLICSQELNVNLKTGQLVPQGKRRNFDNLIVHIHGGGFISQSSFSHQLYSRRWAVQVENSVIFSIDYRLSPQSQFPAAIDDVWQAYLWIINHAKEFLGIDYKKVVIAGDSAGGSLSIALTLMTIQRGFRVPDGLHPLYPSVMCTRNHYTPSLLNAWDDMLLSAAFLNYVLRSYQPSGEHFYLGHDCCFLSPLLAKSEDIVRLPRTRVMTAGIDPLRDDGILFMDKLLAHGVDVKGVEFEFMPHGFMCFKLPLGQGIDEALPAIERSSEMLKELFAGASYEQQIQLHNENNVSMSQDWIMIG